MDSPEDHADELLSTIGDNLPLIRIVELSDGRSIVVKRQPMADGGWVATHEDITEQRRIEARIAHMAHHDALTDLANRVLLRERLEETLERRPRDDKVAVLCMDLDRFKEVNDTLGHPMGDALLKAVAQRLRGCVRDADIVARLGGDEFAILQPAVAPARGRGRARQAHHRRRSACPTSWTAIRSCSAPAWASRLRRRTAPSRTSSSRTPTSRSIAPRATAAAPSASSRPAWMRPRRPAASSSSTCARH